MRLARWFVGLLPGLFLGLGCNTNPQPQGSPKTESKVPDQSENVSGTSRARVTPAMELQRLQGEIANLDKDIELSTSSLARAAVEVDALARNVKDSQANLGKRLAELKALDQDPKTSDGLFAQKWESYKVAEAAVASREKLLKQRQELVRNARARLDATTAARKELKTRVADLETQIEEARLAQPEGLGKIDDSRLGKVKDALDDLDKRVKVMQKGLVIEPTRTEVKAESGDPIRTEGKVRGDEARKEFRARFGGRTP
jgi:chromosome segregation ATPase